MNTAMTPRIYFLVAAAFIIAAICLAYADQGLFCFGCLGLGLIYLSNGLDDWEGA
jgi:hypothetical protein